jgi:hypothetical protein
VKLNSMVDIVCNSSQSDMAEWKQATHKEVSQITNGTESIVTSQGHGTTKLTLKQTSGIWAGVCVIFFPFHPNYQIKKG